VRITEVALTPVAFPEPPLLNSVGVHQPWALRTIVELRSDTGCTGAGETYGDDTHLELLGRVAPLLRDADPFGIEAIRTAIADAVTGGAGDEHGLGAVARPQSAADRVFAAFEVALLDLQGRSLGVPVHALLGGPARDRVPFAAYLFYKWAGHPGQAPDAWGEALDPRGIVAQARRMVARHGFQALKLKGGVLPPDQEVAAVRALSDAFPGVPLRLDPNAAWTVPTSHRVAAELGPCLEYLEDPTPGLEGMADVASTAPLPLATNMCVVSFADLPEAVRRGSVRVVLGDPHYWGGLRRSQELAATCRTFGLGLSMHSNSHLGVSLAAMVHLAAATPHLTYSCDTHTPWAETDVVRAPLRVTGGAVTVPDGPGLGVELDPEALARMHEDYLRCGLRRRDDTAYMRTFDPGFSPRQATW
jgi:glucarate dehydratase